MNNNTQGNYKVEILVQSGDMRNRMISSPIEKLKMVSNMTLDSKVNSVGHNENIIYYRFEIHFNDSQADEIQKLIQELGSQTGKAKMIVNNEVKTISKITDVKGRL